MYTISFFFGLLKSCTGIFYKECGILYILIIAVSFTSKDVLRAREISLQYKATLTTMNVSGHLNLQDAERIT